MRQYDLDGKHEFSKVVRIAANVSSKNAALLVYPNPVVSGRSSVEHPEATGAEQLMIYNSAGALVKNLRPAKGSAKSTLTLPELNAGTYQIMWKGNGKPLSTTTIVQ